MDFYFYDTLIKIFASGDTELQKQNLTTNYYVRELPEPPIDIAKEEDWLPYKSPFSQPQNDEEEITCREDSSMEQFPDDLFTRNSIKRVTIAGSILIKF